ncbi:MAG: hypothetical protein BWK76_26755 [Desulfobulbaceae bacterium A2]|nr:MAG: hypothetical protein BWK76_26755 [Desulfobulbaceae bacterium A2]
MKKKLFLFGVCATMALASSAFAAVTLTRLGEHPFYRSAMTSEADLRTMVKEHSADIQTGLATSGYPELFTDFMAQFPTAKIKFIKVAPGERFGWMLFRKKTSSPVAVIKDVTWGGAAAFDAFSFSIDKGGLRYEFIVPAICGNLSLKKISKVPDPVVPVVSINRDPVCKMTLLSNSELKCGQVIVADVTGTIDPDGSIAQVVFKLLDASNQVVAQKIDTEAPFIQEFTIPCEPSSNRYSVNAVVIDNKGAQSSPADCSQTLTVTQAQRRGGPVVDVGLAHQFDPASYVFARVGYEVPLTENLYAMGLIGGFARIDGHDGGSAVTADALLNYYITKKIFVGAGVGLWAGEDDKIDLIVNAGYLIYENPGKMKTSLFVEGRSATDDLIGQESRLGAGVRFQF